MTVFGKIMSIPLKKFFSTIWKVCIDFKILGLLFLNVFLIYGITWDTILKPNLAQLANRDASLNMERKGLGEKGSLQKQYLMWERELKDLKTELIPIPASASSKIVSVSEAASIHALADGTLRDINVLPPLQSPHNIREKVSLTPVSNITIDLLKPDAATDPINVFSKDAATHLSTTPETTSPPAPSSDNSSKTASSTGDELSNLPAERYDYTLKMTGTYAGLMDFINELVLYKNLIKINQVEIMSDPINNPQPNAESDPEFPIKLNMTLSISLFLYDQNPK